jgi:hypothetical protein
VPGITTGGSCSPGELVPAIDSPGAELVIVVLDPELCPGDELPGDEPPGFPELPLLLLPCCDDP